MLELGVDEVTIVLHKTNNITDGYNWSVVAERLATRFAILADLEQVFGYRLKEDKPVRGYTVSYTYGEHAFYFSINWHPDNSQMCVCVKFSAQSLNYYTEHTRLELYQLLQNVQHSDYTTTLSRIDLTADYINEDTINTTDIYNDLIKRNVGIYDKHPGRTSEEMIYVKRELVLEGIAKMDEMPTFYIGAYGSDIRLRIYDKKREQTETRGSRLMDALKATSWTRFECVLRHKPANNIIDNLLNISNNQEFYNLIGGIILQKYRFMHIKKGMPDTETYYTQMLIDEIGNSDFRLKSTSTHNYELSKSLEYLYSDSGLLSTLYKVKDIWDINTVYQLLVDTLNALEKYNPNDDISRWCNKHTNHYKESYPDFNAFLKIQSPDTYLKLSNEKRGGSHEVSVSDISPFADYWNYELQQRNANTTKGGE